MNKPDDADADDFYGRPSKSARKRDSHALQDLGETLVALSDPLLKELDLPENLYDAVVAARGMKSHGAQLRQRQYIGKLMRKIDSEAVRVALEAQVERQKHATRQALKTNQP